MRFYFLVIIFLSTTARAELLLDTKYIYYSVSSSSKHGLLDKLNTATPIKQGGDNFHGRTDSKISWYFWWKSTSNKCQINKVKVNLEIIFTMPELENSTNEVREVWKRWYPKLLQHEKGHERNALNIAKKIEKGISQLPVYYNCKMLENAANKLGDDLLDKLHQMDKDYDSLTNHGETEGACLSSHL
ncbi:MAG: DUF922 domain-containing protein [Proteobacteria bacterium]|nr:DUF922 domain-containing protein [Pseudomonadota bacterium]NOG59290.1 DUF922 domain-containing protein [Pseudomonadota bacterium]